MSYKISNWVANVRQQLSQLWLHCQSRIMNLEPEDGALSYRVKWLLIGLVTVLFFATIWGIIISSEPEPFSAGDVLARYSKTAESTALPSSVIGVATTGTLIQVANTLLNKQGGYLSNDVTPPGLWLDNIPNWEYGVVVQVRDLAKALREAFSRSQSQSLEDSKLASAESRFNFNHKSWILPQTEAQLVEGIEFLNDYLDRLSDEGEQQAQFYARADNLNYWLKTVETRLGSLSQKLSASVGQRRINTDLSGDSAAAQSTKAPEEIIVKTAWRDIDDVFYEARGSSWAIMHFLRAIEVDFAEVLDKKNARVSLKQIIRELEGAQQAVNSPLIMNGSGFGIFANHSLVMANYISRANAAIIDLRELLSQG